MRPTERAEWRPAGNAPAMPPAQPLFAAIVAQAAAARGGAFTISEIAERLNTPAKVVAACVALHLAAARSIVDPNKLVVPGPEDPVSDDMLGIVRL
jgi:hypothetical protein